MVIALFVGTGINSTGSSGNTGSYRTKTETAIVATIAIILMLGLSRTSAFTAAGSIIQRKWLQQQQQQLRKTNARTVRDDTGTTIAATTTGSPTDVMTDETKSTGTKGRLLVLGGTGYLGQVVCAKAIQEGYSVVTLSRRGTPTSSSSSSSNNNNNIDYRKGDARQKESIANIINEGNICGIVHCIGLLFDTASGLGNYNVYVSGSQSLPDPNSTYDTITRQTAFHAIDAVVDYHTEQQQQQQLQTANTATTGTTSSSTVSFPIPFCFTSAAEAGWPDVMGGPLIESIMPEFIKRYMIAKRAVEQKLLQSSPTNIIRPIIVRPSLIYSPNQFASLPSVTTFTILNKIGLPFVDRPVTVDALATAIVQSMSDTSVVGIQRYPQIDALSK